VEANWFTPRSSTSPNSRPTNRPIGMAGQGTAARNLDAKLMTASDRRIPDEISHAFGEALILLVQWQGGADEPVVSIDGQSVRIGFVFDLVLGRKYADQMPPSMVQLLLTYASKDPKHHPQRAQLMLGPTYEVGAGCLLKWVGDKKSKIV
jgi:hypothetical protein